MFKVAIGHSEDPDNEDAANDIIQQCRSVLGETKPQAGILYSSIDYDYSLVLKTIQTAFPEIQLIGCTSSAELSSQLGYVEGSLLLAVFASDTISMATGVVRDLSKNLSANVAKCVQEVKPKLKSEPVMCLKLSDIFTIGTVEVVKELKNVLGKDFPILGGGASDPWKFTQTREFYGDEILEDAAVLLFFAGPLEYSFSIGSGWQPFTNKKIVIQHEKNVVYKIGDETALDFYKHYLGGPPTLAYPLAVYEKSRDRFYLRVPLQTNEKDGSVVLGGDLPDEAETCICQAELPDLIEATRKGMQQAVGQLKGSPPACALVFTCACRKRVLGTHASEEAQALKEEMIPNTPLIGFYAYGQVSPFAQNLPAFVHNNSIAILLLREKNAT